MTLQIFFREIEFHEFIFRWRKWNWKYYDVSIFFCLRQYYKYLLNFYKVHPIFSSKKKVEWNITNFCHEKICLILFFRLRWQTPNAQYPDKEVLTQSLSSKKAPKVIVTGTTFESFTLSFDHFAPQGYEHEYVVLFKPVSFNISSRGYYYYVFKYLQFQFL